RVNLISWRQIADGKKKRREHDNDDSERPLGPWHLWFFKQRDAVANGLYPCHGCATARERTQKNPCTYRFSWCRKGWRRHDCVRLSTTEHGADHTDSDCASDDRHESDHREHKGQ